MNTSARDLIDLHDLHQLKYRYVRSVDTQNFDLMATCFTADARAWFAGGAFTFDGREKIIGFLRQLITPSFVSSHIVVHPELKLTGPGTAEGIWRMQDTVYFTAANPIYAHANLTGGEQLTGAAYYHDEYVKEADGWKMRSIGFIRIFEVIERKEARRGIDLKIEASRGMQGQ
jgi:hypothetical protein